MKENGKYDIRLTKPVVSWYDMWEQGRSFRGKECPFVNRRDV
jgi:hypothetical protein